MNIHLILRKIRGQPWVCLLVKVIDHEGFVSHRIRQKTSVCRKYATKVSDHEVDSDESSNIVPENSDFETMIEPVSLVGIVVCCSKMSYLDTPEIEPSVLAWWSDEHFRVSRLFLGLPRGKQTLRCRLLASLSFRRMNCFRFSLCSFCHWVLSTSSNRFSWISINNDNIFICSILSWNMKIRVNWRWSRSSFVTWNYLSSSTSNHRIVKHWNKSYRKVGRRRDWAWWVEHRLVTGRCTRRIVSRMIWNEIWSIYRLVENWKTISNYSRIFKWRFSNSCWRPRISFRIRRHRKLSSSPSFASFSRKISPSHR